MNRRIVLIQPACGKYDLFIRDMPLGLVYTARMLVAEGYDVHIVDQRVLKEATREKVKTLVTEVEPLWVGFTVMTGEPIFHAMRLAELVRQHTKAPLLWGGIHPTILPEVTIAHPLVDYLIRGKGERSALAFSKALEAGGGFDGVPGLTWTENGTVRSNEEDDDSTWGKMPPIPYDLVNLDDYARVGFEARVFPIMTSRNCPHKCTFCYNSALKQKLRWFPDSIEDTISNIDDILARYRPSYLSFIDDDFFVDLERSRAILRHVEKVKPAHIKVGFRGVRVSDMRLMTDEDLDLLERINTRHINIGVESGSDRVLKLLKKGMKAEHAVAMNRRFAKHKDFVPLYNFFSGIPGETEDDIRLSTRLILQLTAENPNCQISGFHQYTPYPGNELFNVAVEAGFPVPQTLEEWGDQRFEDNAKKCPWIDSRRRRLLEMIYCMIYFVDGKYDMYFANNNWLLKAMHPLINLYKPLARFRLRHHLTALPLEVWAKDAFYALFYRPTKG